MVRARQFFFVHLQKTAETSLVWMLRKQFGRRAVYPDDSDDFGLRLQTQFGWDLGQKRHLNRSEQTPVSSAFRERITRDNAADIELYEFARELVGSG